MTSTEKLRRATPVCLAFVAGTLLALTGCEPRESTAPPATTAPSPAAGTNGAPTDTVPAPTDSDPMESAAAQQPALTTPEAAEAVMPPEPPVDATTPAPKQPEAPVASVPVEAEAPAMDTPAEPAPAEEAPASDQTKAEEPKPEETLASTDVAVTTPEAETKPEAATDVKPAAADAASANGQVALGVEAAKEKDPEHWPTYAATVHWLPTPSEIADATAKTQDEMKAYTEVIPGADVKFDMVPIKGGTFMMGSPESEEGRADDEGPQHEVEIDPFWMGKCEVTWDEYELWCMKLDKTRRELKKQDPTDYDKLADAVAMPTNPYTDMSFGMGKDGYPAICMTQLAAKMYCKWLSAKTGRYYRLPTEAEWEYAARAGTTGPYSFEVDAIDDYAWYIDNSDDKYQKVGKKKPNPWGLHDMHGNVSEWVLDQYADYSQFGGKVSKNPLVPGTTEYERVVRGGSWYDDPEQLRSAVRRVSERDWKQQDPQIPQSIWYLTDADFLGFRVVRPLKAPTPEEAKTFEVDEEQYIELEDYLQAQAGKM
ncbi:MAG: SUMF1/EgtB/PvdO family nonheme iron enzyme [Planctomycetota bacterium]